MTRVADLYGFHVDPIDTAEALHAALGDPQRRWYGLRRLAAVAASGALVAQAWNPKMHPRGHDGKFIEKYGWVRWLDDKNQWRQGWVSDIDPVTGAITVRQGAQHLAFPNAKNLYAKPKPKASLTLPNVVTKTTPDGFTKVGGQGGSNPGATFQIDKTFATGSPDISARNGMLSTLGAMSNVGSQPMRPKDLDTNATAAALFPPNINVVMVPALDGTAGKYDVLQRLGPNWYRVPASGSMTDNDLMRADLQVDPVDAFGEPGAARRYNVLNDNGTVGVERSQGFDVNDAAEMVQQSASPLPEIGDSYYVKTMDSPERAQNEALANDFYELLGVPVPDVAVGNDGVTVSSKIVEPTVPFDPNNLDHRLAAQQGFIADAWLANWDVVGLGYDNLKVDSDGRVWRIDAGGALAYRAQGTPKGAMFGDQVGELKSLNDPSLNPQSAKVFGGMTHAKLVSEATVLQSISPVVIMNQADRHGLHDVGTTLVARRKSILDQLGIQDPAPDTAALPASPPTVFNPVEAVNQMGSPPTVGVANYNLVIGALPTLKFDQSDWQEPGWPTDHILVHDGDLWTPVSAPEDLGGGLHRGRYRNAFTGEAKNIAVQDGYNEFLGGNATTDNAADLADQFTPSRDLAIAEIVARTNKVPISGLGQGSVNEPGDPEGMLYGEIGLPNWATLQAADDNARLGPDHSWPLRRGNALYEITHWPTDVNDQLVLTKRTPDLLEGAPVYKIYPNGGDMASSGPWFTARNDTTAKIWQSKLTPDPATVDPATLAQTADMAQTIDAHEQGALDPLDLHGPDGTPSIATPGVDFSIPSPVTHSVLPSEQQDANDTVNAPAAPTTSVKVEHDVAATLAPSEPMLSSEWAVSDLAQLQTDLVGKSVVVLPESAHDNPDFGATTTDQMGVGNGLGVVTDVSVAKTYIKGHYDANAVYVAPQYNAEVVRVSVKMSNGSTYYVNGGESGHGRVVIPVDTTPFPASKVMIKQNDDVLVNGERVGTYWAPYQIPTKYSNAYYAYAVTIDGDHSLTGKPYTVYAHQKTGLRQAIPDFVVPIAPPVHKTKSGKTIKTEQEIKDLNAQLTDVQQQIDLTEQQLAEIATPSTGVPLADGTTPKVGDWVFSTKDGTYAQIKQTDLHFGAKHKQDPAGFLRVGIPVVQPDGSTKFKTTLRSRNTLVSAAGPGQTPWVLQTKAQKTLTGFWYGPGSTVTITDGEPTGVKVLDTTVDGKTKYLGSDGTAHWIGKGKVIGIAAGTGGPPALKTPASSTDADALNNALAELNDIHANLAAVIATSVVAKPKKKKDYGTPYPGPGGLTYAQPPDLAQAREAKGLRNTKDNYVPVPGMILRHNDGTQYVVVEMGHSNSTHKNSVMVVPVGHPYDKKWRSVSTMFVDHDAMLRDTDGKPLPVITSFDGFDGWKPPASGLLLRKEITAGYWQKDPVTGKSAYRSVPVARFYIVGYDGKVWNLDGSPAGPMAVSPSYEIDRVGYIDVNQPNGKKLTASIQQHQSASVGQIQYAVVHDPNTPAGIPLAQASAPAAPDAPLPADELPVFTGKNPSGMEMPHPPTVKSSAGVPPFTTSAAPQTLDQVPLAQAHSVVSAVQATLARAAQNKADGRKDWVAQYSLADHDKIEDMLVQTQTVRDANGVEYVETSFRESVAGARATNKTFITSSMNEVGDWETTNRNVFNVVPGDFIAVRVSSGGGATPQGALKPVDGASVPNAQVVSTPVLIGKNKAGNYDVYRMQVLTAGGDTGYVDVEDRNGTDSITIQMWDPAKVRATNGAKGLNPNMSDAGWSVKSNALSWPSNGTWQASEIMPDGVKKMPTTFVTAAPYSGGHGADQSFGTGWVLERDYNDAHIEYATSMQKNSLDGRVTIRVRADDPDAAQKISDAMELVGVSKADQTPPDNKALIKLATDEVWEQFTPIYDRGKKPNNPEEALAAIDKAVGAQLGRPATLNDISLRFAADGRMQTLVSEDVAKAIVKKNGVHDYIHRFTGKGKRDMVESILSGETPGIMSTTERFQNGIFITGMSSGDDHKHDSADHLFLTLDKSGSMSHGTWSLVIDPVALHRHTGYYFRPGDSYGSRESDNLNWLNKPSDGGEMMVSRRLGPDAVSYIRVSSDERQMLLDRLHKKGITTLPDGRPIEDFIVTATPAEIPPVNFGDEITLSSLAVAPNPTAPAGV
jgi:hypothetical protein